MYKLWKSFTGRSCILPSGGAKTSMEMVSVAEENELNGQLQITRINENTLSALLRLMDSLLRTSGQNDEIAKQEKRLEYYRRK